MEQSPEPYPVINSMIVEIGVVHSSPQLSQTRAEEPVVPITTTFIQEEITATLSPYPQGSLDSLLSYDPSTLGLSRPAAPDAYLWAYNFEMDCRSYVPPNIETLPFWTSRG